MRPAIATFVKTLGSSALKTRLAADIGQKAAERFYELSVSAVESVLKQQVDAGHSCAYWAVAEPHARQVWHGFPVLGQGSGGLGQRMQRIYERLLAIHGQVVLMAADSPQISMPLFAQVWSGLNHADFVMGPANDGGFYLLAGRKVISPEIWTSVTYSRADTGRQMYDQLRRLGSVLFLPELSDVDRQSDLLPVLDQISSLSDQTLEQKMLAYWLESYVTISAV